MKYPYPYPASSALKSAYRVVPANNGMAKQLKNDWYREKSLQLFDRQVRYQKRMAQFQERARLMREQRALSAK